MNVIEYGKPCGRQIAVLGRFECLHRGHESIIIKARSLADKLNCGVLLMTFDLPENVRKRGLLLNFDERIERAEALGVTDVMRVEFDDGFKNQSPQEFLDVLYGSTQLCAVACGYDFRFGKDRAGNAGTVAEFCRQRGIDAIVAGELDYDGERISSTKIAEYVESGDIPRANAMLGYRYFCTGNVVQGRKEGRKMGFPTANMSWQEGKLKPLCGVYAVRSSIDGRVYKGITNVGSAPTFGIDTQTVETYFVGYTGDLYGRELRIEFDKYIRSQTKFASEGELKDRLKKDLCILEEDK